MPAPPSTKTLPTFQRGHDRNKKPKGVPQRRTPAPTTSAAPPGAM
jgi:hypothetical protein